MSYEEGLEDKERALSLGLLYLLAMPEYQHLRREYQVAVIAA